LTTDQNSLPGSFALGQNYPNPFNPSTVIAFELPTPGHINLSIYNVLGQRVRTLIDSRYPPGTHETTWDGRDDSGQPVSSGVYLYRLEATGLTATKKMVLMK
jgi:hypothetical protein